VFAFTPPLSSPFFFLSFPVILDLSLELFSPSPTLPISIPHLFWFECTGLSVAVPVFVFPYSIAFCSYVNAARN
jgi:hypothetical protein